MKNKILLFILCIIKAKIMIICFACSIVFFAGCNKKVVCKDGLEIWNLPALDWEQYYNIKTLSPYSHHYDNSNDSNFQDRQVKVTGWFVPNSIYEHYNISGFILSDDERVTTDYNFKPDITLEICAWNNEVIGKDGNVTKEMLQHLIDSVDITQKCYVVGVLMVKDITAYDLPNQICREYSPVLSVYNINNISFGKEVENEK